MLFIVIKNMTEAEEYLLESVTAALRTKVNLRSDAPEEDERTLPKKIDHHFLVKKMLKNKIKTIPIERVHS